MSPVGAARTAASSFYVDCRDESAPLDAWDHTQKVCLDKRWLYDWQVPQTPGASSFATLCSDPVYDPQHSDGRVGPVLPAHQGRQTRGWHLRQDESPPRREES
ncbi:unnamed protein product [Prorocentrum cordatum]|uniref:Uncharacterized protein n=1 Tax=Prorocentrum cordatum TaxID=2364126 RepID=A0ABN9UEF2_9DINO|nr:unnamed protein product [Polarella glacialis]